MFLKHIMSIFNYLKVISEFNNIIVSASHDNYVYVWIRAMHDINKRIKIKDHEKFMPFPNSKLKNTFSQNFRIYF